MLLNHNEVTVKMSAKIGDVLKIKGSETSCEFIKVVQHET